MTSPIFLSISVPILILIANNIYTSTRDSVKNYDKRISEKLNKVEYEKDQVAVSTMVSGFFFVYLQCKKVLK